MHTLVLVEHCPKEWASADGRGLDGPEVGAGIVVAGQAPAAVGLALAGVVDIAVGALAALAGEPPAPAVVHTALVAVAAAVHIAEVAAVRIAVAAVQTVAAADTDPVAKENKKVLNISTCQHSSPAYE